MVVPRREPALLPRRELGTDRWGSDRIVDHSRRSARAKSRKNERHLARPFQP